MSVNQIWLVLLMGLCGFVAADNGLVDALSNRARLIDSMEGSFVQERSISVLPLPLRSEGDFSYSRRNGLQWDTLVPVQSQLNIGSNGIRIDGQLVQGAQSGRMAEVMLAVFSGDLQPLLTQFEVVAKGELADWCLILRPESELLSSKIESIEISGGESTEYVRFLDANGDSTVLHIATKSIISLSE